MCIRDRCQPLISLFQILLQKGRQLQVTGQPTTKPKVLIGPSLRDAVLQLPAGQRHFFVDIAPSASGFPFSLIIPHHGLPGRPHRASRAHQSVSYTHLHVINFNAPIETMLRLGGGVPVEAGCATEVVVEDVEELINEKTVALLYVKSHHCVQKGMLDLPTMIDIAHRHNLPLMVDAAAEEDFRKYIAMGADLVCYSGAKALEATTSGFVTGKKELISYIKKQYHGVGRAMKVGKEAIMGLLAALEQYENKDKKAEVEKNVKIVDLSLIHI